MQFYERDITKNVNRCYNETRKKYNNKIYRSRPFQGDSFLCWSHELAEVGGDFTMICDSSTDFIRNRIRGDQ